MSTCPRCGGAVAPSDAFCGVCGTKNAGNANITTNAASPYPPPAAPPWGNASAHRVSFPIEAIFVVVAAVGAMPLLSLLFSNAPPARFIQSLILGAHQSLQSFTGIAGVLLVALCVSLFISAIRYPRGLYKTGALIATGTTALYAVYVLICAVFFRALFLHMQLGFERSIFVIIRLPRILLALILAGFFVMTLLRVMASRSVAATASGIAAMAVLALCALTALFRMGDSRMWWLYVIFTPLAMVLFALSLLLSRSSATAFSTAASYNAPPTYIPPVQYGYAQGANFTAAGMEQPTMQKKNPVATFTMENGKKLMVELYPDKAPITVANFVELANTGFFNGLSFHRVVSGFVIQGGSKSNTCAGGGEGFTIKGEFAMNGVDTGLTHDRGVISMARSSHPDSGSTQFFICHQDAKNLDKQYAAFGKLIEGFDVLDEIAGQQVNPADSKPITQQFFTTVTIDAGDYTPVPPQRIAG